MYSKQMIPGEKLVPLPLDRNVIALQQITDEEFEILKEKGKRILGYG